MTDSTTGDGPQARPEWTWRERERGSRIRGVFLDPDVQPADLPEVHATFYQPDVLLIAPSARGRRRGDRIKRLDGLAKQWGWDVKRADLEEPIPDEVRRMAERPGERMRLPGVAQTVRARITISPDAEADPTRPVQRPDAWRLLREARREGITGVSLNHILTVDPIGVNPFKANPFKANPFKANPFKANPAGIDGYAIRDSAGVSPSTTAVPPCRGPTSRKAHVGPWWRCWTPDAATTRGSPETCWWTPKKEYGGAIGIVDDLSDPEVHPSLADPLDGIIDEAAGHGTFIAGLVLQSCPGARILPVRVADGQGIILENELIAALGRIVDLLESEKATIDVLNLSFSFYHESPELAAVDSELYALLKRVRAKRCIVVCSAGNDATDRPASPAALYSYDGAELGIETGTEGRHRSARRGRALSIPPAARSRCSRMSAIG